MTIRVTFELDSEKFLEFLIIVRTSWADSLEIERISRACERSEASVDFRIVFLCRDMRHLDKYYRRLPVRESDL